MKPLLRSLALLALVSACPAKVAVVFRLASPPLPVEAGQHFSLCAANVGTVNTDLTLQFVSVRTGAIVASRDVTLPPPGPGTGTLDPCLQISADGLLAPGSPSADSPLIVALVVIKRGLFSRAAAVTASVQVTVTDPSGGHHILASIPLQLATLINGRNTPIERVP